ncbi:MAG: NADH-quinone oxidoreductase subunit N [Nitrospirota bacterium]|nr:NADH-quinone oxidoreductase subunit N [Nitrospirota bacterium]
MNNLESLTYFASEGFLSVYIILLLAASLLIRKEQGTPGLYYSLGIFGLAVTLALEIVACATRPGSTEIFHGLLRSDSLGRLFKILCLVSGILFLLFSLLARETSKRFRDSMEYTVLALSLCLGMMLFIASNNILMLYLGMELLSFTSYLLTGFVDRDERTTEAAVKYLLYGAVASGVMIYGFSLLYGLTGSLDFSAIRAYLVANQVSGSMLFISIAFILTGLGFKIAAFPFHLWSPDVYEGAPTAFSAFLSVGPKAAGFAILMRVLYQVFGVGAQAEAPPAAQFDWTFTIAVLSALTMTVGNLAALPQRNIKRLLAYSSIAHAGYALMAVASRSAFGISAVFFYFAVYLLMNLAAFLVAIVIANEYYTERLDGYEGLGWKGPQGAFLASAMAIALFSLAGIPPFAGFIGKVYLLMAVIKKGPGLYWLAVVAVLNTVISLFYYARVVKMMFLSKRVKGAPLSAMTTERYVSYAVLGVLTFLTLLFGLYWTPLDSLSKLTMNFLN